MDNILEAFFPKDRKLDGMIARLDQNRNIWVGEQSGLVLIDFTTEKRKTPILLSKEAAFALRDLLNRLLPTDWI